MGDDTIDAVLVGATAAGHGMHPLRADHHRHRIARADLTRGLHGEPTTRLEHCDRPLRRCVENTGHHVRRADEASNEDAGRGVIDLLRRADLLDTPTAHDCDAIAHRERFTLVVGDEDEGDAHLALDALEFDLHRLTQLEIERGERLVEQQCAGHVDERTGERNTLLLAARQLVRSAIAELGEANDVEHLLGPAGRLRRGDTLGAQAERHVLEHTHVWEQCVGLEHRVDVALVGRHARDVGAFEHDAPAAWLLEARDHLQDRGLATS